MKTWVNMALVLALTVWMGTFFTGCTVYDAARDERSIGTFADDKNITAKVKYRLLKDETVKGLDISVYLDIIIVLLIAVAALKMDGIHEGGLVLLSMVLARIIKLPAEGYALILGIAPIIYQIESVVNVSGNACISYIITHSEGAVSEVALKEFV